MLQRCCSFGKPRVSTAKLIRDHPHQRNLQRCVIPLAEEAAALNYEGDTRSPARHSFQGLLLDAAGTLISPSEPVAEVYQRYGRRHGCSRSEAEILSGFRRAFNTPWAKTTSRYVGDGRPFWEFIVRESTGCDSPELLEEVYEYFSLPQAWAIAPGAVAALQSIRSAGIKLGLVSNFDTRLRPLLIRMELAPLFDTLIISAEEGFEKPNPVLFERACARLGVDPESTVHVGDDRRNDVQGARLAGCHAWLWGSDVSSFDELAPLVMHGLASESDL